METNNSSIQIINSESAVASILDKFSTDFIMDVISDNIKMKFRPFNVGPANLSIVLEQNFSMAAMENPNYRDQIDGTRAETHREVINTICKYYNLSFVGEEYQEYTTDELAALSTMMYDVFITNFTEKMVWFFGRYIIDNKESIYKSIENADEIRKNKETTAYGKKLYVDPQLVVIHSCMNSVLENVACHDIPFETVMSYLVEPEKAAYLTNALQDNNDIYKYYYASYIRDPITKPDLFTAIKFQFQNMGAREVDPMQITAEQ